MRAGNLHPYLNSSNLATRALEQTGQFRGKLAQFCGRRAVVRGDCQGLPLQLQHTAGAHQGGRCYPLIVPLQCNKLCRLKG